METQTTPQPVQEVKTEPQNSGGIVGVERDDSGKFLPGHEKMGGKKKGHRHLATLLREGLASLGKGATITYSQALIRKMMDMAINEGNIEVIKMIWHYMEGMPVQRTAFKDYTGEDDDDEEEEDDLSPEVYRAIAKSLQADYDLDHQKSKTNKEQGSGLPAQPIHTQAQNPNGDGQATGVPRPSIPTPAA